MNDHAKFLQMLKQFHTGMLITHDGTKLRARPMFIAHIDDNCQMWFLSPRECAKVHEIELNTKVQLICQNDRSSYVSLSGVASLIDDRAQIAMVWKEPFRVYFPKGIEDPDMVLIAVKPLEGEYWDSSGVNSIKYLFDAAKAYLSGEKIAVHDGEMHGVVSL